VIAESCKISSEVLELRQQVGYWQAAHRRAVEREAVLRERIGELEPVVREQAIEIRKLREQVEALKAKIALLSREVFGRSSEASTEEQQERGVGAGSQAAVSPGRKRGKQPGAKGYGRRRRTNLPTVEVVHDLPEAQKRCPICGKPFAIFPGTEDSEELDWEVRIVRRIHRRARYVRTCTCNEVRRIVTVQAPAKLIAKGMFSVDFWVRVLLEKFLFQRPLYRVVQMLSLQGLDISQGTLTGGLRRIGELVQPLYALILEHNRSARHWHMDETRWMVFAELEGKANHRWWLWVSVTYDSCCYILDPHRSAEVPRSHLGADAEGVISADRYSAYKALGGRKLHIAFCWSHVRRDFVRIHDGYRTLRRWAADWIALINELFDLNGKRLRIRAQPECFACADQTLRRAVAAMVERRDRELAEDGLREAQRKALVSLFEHWDGLVLFVEDPDIPMDNNEAERRLRNPVVGRKNYYGSAALWSGTLCAMLFTVMQTLLINQLNTSAWLSAYLHACAQNGSKPPKDIASFLPWNLSQERRATWHLQQRCRSDPP
jgi:transposase